MGKQLYGDPALAIRELYQNSLDACRWRDTRKEYRRRKFGMADDWTGEIRLTQAIDEHGRPYIECEDNGVGMDLNTLKHVFANAGERFVYGQEFRAEQADWAELTPPLRMVSNSQFGVGVFSYFMLADEITVTTRHQRRNGVPDPDAHEVRIASSGSLFQITPAPRELPSGGTRVRLYLSGDATNVSVLRTLRGLLWVTEHHVTVTAADGTEAWAPGELRYRDGSLAPLKCGEDLWWVPYGGGLVADGIRTDFTFPGLVVNLRGEHRPRFTVDRKTLRSWDEDWVDSQVDAHLPELMMWPGFTLSWLWSMAPSDAATTMRWLRQIFAHAAAAGKRIEVGNEPSGEPVPVSATGWLVADSSLLDVNINVSLDMNFNLAVFSGIIRRLRIWRAGVWHQLGYPLRSSSSTYLSHDREILHLIPVRIDGFPVPDPVDGALLGNLPKSTYSDRVDVNELVALASRNRCTPRQAVRRLRKYAIVGLDFSPVRAVASIDRIINANRYVEVLAWPMPAAEPERASLVMRLVRASLWEGESPGELARRARAMGLEGWSSFAPDRIRVIDDAVHEAELIVRSCGQRRNLAQLSGEVSPAVLAEACLESEVSIATLLECCDAMAPAGVTVPLRTAYPAELDSIGLEALRYVDQPGQLLTAVELVLIAAHSGVTVGAARDALAGHAERGLLALPELIHGAGYLPTPDDVALITGESATGRFPEAVPKERGALWLRITGIVTRQGEADETWLPASYRLAPFAAPRRRLTGAELAAAAWELQTTLASAAAAIKQTFPDVLLPDIPAGCAELSVSRAAHNALFATEDNPIFVQEVRCDWGLTPSAIVGGAWRTSRQLGDYLASLDPFRRLGAPVPPCNPAIRKTLNEVVLDDRDVDMLKGAPDGITSVTALSLVQTAGRFGWTLAEAHQRFARLAPLGLELGYPIGIEFADEIVRWQDLLVLTTYFDGQAPVVAGQVTWEYLAKAAEEIFDCPPEKAAAHTAWLRDRLKIYASLFELQLPEDTE
jgi:hypothetical protein